MAFNVAGELLSSKYLKESDIIDDYIGNTLLAWGSNGGGCVGDSTTTQRSVPVQTTGGGNTWKTTSAGGDFTLALKTDGTLWGWGTNSSGQLGNGGSGNYSSPVQAYSHSNWSQISAGRFHSAGIKTDGTLWLFGNGSYGGMGDGSGVPRSSPVQTTSAGTNWKQVSVGLYCSAAVKTDGTLWTWGYNNQGQLGTNNTTLRTSPGQTVSTDTNWKLIAVSQYHMAAIKTDGTLWCWGQGTVGQHGNNSTQNQSSPVQTVAAGTNWKSVSCGAFTTAAIKTDGTLWVWGQGAYGTLGDGTDISKSSPVQTAAAGTNWKQVECGNYHMAAIKTDGTLWLWGMNQYYSPVGDGTLIVRSSPVQTAAAGSNWKMVSAGQYHTAAITFSDQQ